MREARPLWEGFPHLGGLWCIRCRPTVLYLLTLACFLQRHPRVVFRFVGEDIPFVSKIYDTCISFLNFVHILYLTGRQRAIYHESKKLLYLAVMGSTESVAGEGPTKHTTCRNGIRDINSLLKLSREFSILSSKVTEGLCLVFKLKDFDNGVGRSAIYELVKGFDVKNRHCISHLASRHCLC